MNNFVSYITPEKAQFLDNQLKDGRRKSLNYYKNLSKNDAECSNCSEKVWKLADTGLCFSCTTGEADASDDYELE